ncbi:hypothetical protein V8C42DRAFT_311303 [Trichoderma barbatum]
MHDQPTKSGIEPRRANQRRRQRAIMRKGGQMSWLAVGRVAPASERYQRPPTVQDLAPEDASAKAGGICKL